MSIELLKGILIYEVVLESLMIYVPMQLKSMSRPGNFFAKVAGKGHSFQMVCFNVFLYSTAHPFLSTHFANVSFSKPICIVVFTFLHHGLHSFVKIV